MAYLKPQSPLKHKDGDYFYPLTTVDQIVMEDGSRLNTKMGNSLSVDFEGSNAGEINPINADTLGGYPPEYFLNNAGGGSSTSTEINIQTKPRAGFIYPLASNVIPDGFVLCDGAEYSRSEYSELFEAIGTIYGAGNGSTTFNVPNLQTRVPVGASEGYELGQVGGEAEHTLTVDEMPSHDHNVSKGETHDNLVMMANAQNLFSLAANGTGGGDWEWSYGVPEQGGSQPHNNMQPYMVVNYIISTGKDTGINIADVITDIRTLPLGVENGGTGATDAATARANLGIRATARNLLDNSDFINPVNQSGLTDVTAEAEIVNFIDRWQCCRGIFSLNANGITMGWDNVTGSNAFIRETIKGNFAQGDIYTLAAEIDGEVYSAIITLNAAGENSIGNLYSGTFFNIALSSDGSLLYVYLYTNSQLSIKWFALYEGEYTAETLPEYQPKGYANELLACNVADNLSITGLNMDLLWQNASPTSEFASQELPVDASDYKMIYISFLLHTSSSYEISALVVVGKIGRVVYANYPSEGFITGYRQILSKTTSNKVQIGNFNGVQRTSSTNWNSLSTANSHVIPLEIYGIK